MKCPRCGRENPSNATSCISCGARFIRKVPVSKPQKKSVNKGLFATIIALCGVLLIVVAIYLIDEFASDSSNGFPIPGGPPTTLQNTPNNESKPADDDTEKEALPEWAMYFTSVNWVNNIGGYNVYKFHDDGTVTGFGDGVRYEIKNDTLRIYSPDGREYNLKWVTKAEKIDWDKEIVDDLPDSGNFFYQTDWVDDGKEPSTNAMYLREETQEDIQIHGSQDGDASKDESQSTSGSQSSANAGLPANKYQEFIVKMGDLTKQRIMKVELAANEADKAEELFILCESWMELGREIYDYEKGVLNSYFAAKAKDCVDSTTDSMDNDPEIAVGDNYTDAEKIRANSVRYDYLETQCIELMAILKASQRGLEKWSYSKTEAEELVSVNYSDAVDVTNQLKADLNKYGTDPESKLMIWTNVYQQRKIIFMETYTYLTEYFDHNKIDTTSFEEGIRNWMADANRKDAELQPLNTVEKNVTRMGIWCDTFEHMNEWAMGYITEG